MGKRSKSDDRLRQKRKRVGKRLPAAEETIRGSITERYIECGKAGCRCHKEGGHGPYYYFVVTKGVGKTISFKLPSSSKTEAEKWVRNYKKLKKGLEEISDINREILKRKEK